MFKHSIQYPLYFPDEPVPDEPVVTDMDVLNEEDEKPDEKEEELDDLPTEEELEEEEKEPDDKKVKKDEVNEEELTRLTARDIKAKLGDDVFTKLPQLKNTVYREQKYTEIFPNPADAEVALKDQEHLTNLRDLVLSGDAEQIIGSIKEVNTDSLKSFAEGFLPALQKADKETYIEITKPVIRAILRSVSQFGKNHEDTEKGKNFINAAKVVNFAIFEDYDLGKVEEEKKPARDEKFDKEKEEYYAGKQNELFKSVNTDVEKGLDDIIGDIDPNGVLKNRPNLKAKIIKNIKDDIREAMQKDTIHMTKMNGYWDREKRNGFSGSLKESIKTTFLSRARMLAPEIRKRVRADYLGIQKDSDKKLKEKAEGRDKNLNPGTPSNNKSSKAVTAKEAKVKGMSAMDVLNS